MELMPDVRMSAHDTECDDGIKDAKRVTEGYGDPDNTRRLLGLTRYRCNEVTCRLEDEIDSHCDDISKVVLWEKFLLLKMVTHLRDMFFEVDGANKYTWEVDYNQWGSKKRGEFWDFESAKSE